MTFAVAKRAVDLFMSRTDRLNIRFFGGEPLLEFKLLMKVVEYAKKRAGQLDKNVEFVLVTNGTLFNRNVADFFKKHKIKFSLSFDGVEEAQDANRVFISGKSSFGVITRNIPHMLECNPMALCVVVASPNTVEYLFDSIKFVLESGFRMIAISLNFNDEEFGNHLLTIKREYLKLADYYKAYRESGKWAYLDIFDPPGSQLDGDGRCRAGRDDFSIDINGDIYPCCCFVDEKRYLLGNVDSGVDVEKAAIFTKDLKALHEHIDRDHKDCPDTSYCKKGCGCTNLVTSKVLYETIPVICRYGKMEAEVRAYYNAARVACPSSKTAPLLSG